MISKVSKRDGRLEDFSPNKINQWGVWAAKSLGPEVDWSSVVLDTVSTLPEVCDSQLLQERLVKNCLDRGTHLYNRMAGKLYAALLNKRIHGEVIPTVQELHTKLFERGLMVKLDYSDEEYAQAERYIKHKRDFKATYAELHSISEKYAIKNRKTDEIYETQQFMYMRMAMALAEDQPKFRRMNDVRAFYEHLSNKRLNAPTPNHINLGTPLNGYASCCVYKTHDNARSLAIGDHIAYTMTYMSAGIGSYLECRTLGDPVRSGAILHQGKLPYYRSMVAAVKANMQAGRGGACSTYYTMFDPEVETIVHLKNPMSTEDKKIRGMDYTLMVNKYLMRKVAMGEKIFTFTRFTAPDLYDAFFGSDTDRFAELYELYEANIEFPKNYIDARNIVLTAANEGIETGRAYLFWVDEVNYHTPFKDPIYSSNLCLEIALPTKGYDHMSDLYSTEDHGRGEIALCSLAGILPANIEDDAQYEDVFYYALLMIDKCLHKNYYELPHLGLTAKSRLNAGVGLVGVAHYMARNKKKYSTPDGKRFLHELAERHMYFGIKASVRLAEELGVAPWAHKTKWADGWLPIDTYNKNVDTIVDPTLNYDWEELRARVVATGGLRNSCLVAHMPSETSSKASGTSNGIYPVRYLSQMKGDSDTIVKWAAPESDRLGKHYELAFDIQTEDMIDVYAIFQKFADQSISADEYHRLIGDETVSSDTILKNLFRMTKYGMKSRYYTNTQTTKAVAFDEISDEEAAEMGYLNMQAELAAETMVEEERGCAGGFCTL